MLKYADDVALLSKNKGSPEEMYNTMQQVLESYGIKINKGKTKVIVCGGKEQRNWIKIGDRGVKEFNYLSCKITKSEENKMWKKDAKIKYRIHSTKWHLMNRRHFSQQIV